MKKDQQSLVVQSLLQDSRIEEAKKLILNAVKEHQSSIQGIKPSNPELEAAYEKALNDFTESRGSKLWFPYIGSGIGNGVFVELLDGSIKYDFITGIGPHVLGHSHPALIAASLDAALGNTIMQGHLQQNKDTLDLAQSLMKACKMDHCFLTTSGAMANENALKIAFQKRFPAKRVLAFDRTFAGRTLALSQITDKPSFREGLPATIDVDYIPFYDATKHEESISNSVSALKRHLERHPKEYAIMCLELVQGEGGFYPGHKEFFMPIMQLLKENNISIFVDEVQTFGRTPALCAFHYFELENYVDILSIGKMSQVCATLFNKDHNPKPGLLSQTFIGSTASIHASKAILNELLNNNYFGKHGRNVAIFNYFSQKLQELQKKHPKWVSGPFGIGSMIAFTPFDGEEKRTTKFVHALFKAGVMSFIAGIRPTRTRFLVPTAVIKNEHIDAVVGIIEETLKNESK